MHAPRPRNLPGDRRRDAGFTLLELIVVMIVMAIAAAMVVPYAMSDSDLHAKSAARQLMGDLEYAQNQAIVTQTEVKVSFDTSSNSYTVSKQSVTLIHPITKKPFQVDLDTEGAYEGVEVNAARFGSGSEVTFNALGTPSPDGYVDIVSGAHTFRVTVAPVTGRVSVDKVQ